METTMRLIILVISMVIVISILLSMIRKKSSAILSLMWIVVAFLIMLLGIFPQLINFAAALLGISYQPTLIMIVAIAGMIWLLFYLSSELAIAQTKIRELAMQISLLNNEMAIIKEVQSEKSVPSGENASLTQNGVQTK